MPAFSGVSHISFSARNAEARLKVDGREALDEWKAHFERLGVVHSPIAEREYGAVLTFKDPDGIQFEMFYRADHP